MWNAGMAGTPRWSCHQALHHIMACCNLSSQSWLIGNGCWRKSQSGCCKNQPERGHFPWAINTKTVCGMCVLVSSSELFKRCTVHWGSAATHCMSAQSTGNPIFLLKSTSMKRWWHQTLSDGCSEVQNMVDISLSRNDQQLGKTKNKLQFAHDEENVDVSLNASFLKSQKFKMKFQNEMQQKWIPKHLSVIGKNAESSTAKISPQIAHLRLNFSFWHQKIFQTCTASIAALIGCSLLHWCDMPQWFLGSSLFQKFWMTHDWEKEEEAKCMAQNVVFEFCMRGHLIECQFWCGCRFWPRCHSWFVDFSGYLHFSARNPCMSICGHRSAIIKFADFFIQWDGALQRWHILLFLWANHRKMEVNHHKLANCKH